MNSLIEEQLNVLFDSETYAAELKKTKGKPTQDIQPLTHFT